MPPSWTPPDINIMPGESCGTPLAFGLSSLYIVIQVIVGVLHRVPAAQAQHLPPLLRHEDGHHAGHEKIFKYVLKSESIS